GNDRLDGGTGADIMHGGKGNDTYFVDNPNDQAIEGAGEGHDIVFASGDYTLAAGSEIEILHAHVSDATGLHLTGNELDNRIYGGVGNDTLDGGGGADTLIGGAGDDTYIVNNAGVRIIEGINAGTDTVQSSISTTLGANLENLTLTGHDAIN